MGRLAKKILAAREIEVTVGEWTFVTRRPDAMASASWVGLSGQELAERILTDCVVNWRGVLERDLVGDDGSDQPVPFDHEDFLIWARDRPEIWSPVVDAVLDSVKQWAERIEAGRKN